MNTTAPHVSLFFDVPHPNQQGGGAHRIHVRYWPAVGDVSHLPLFCVHGLTRNGGDFATLAGKLSKTRDVYAVDMPGRGQSARFEDPALYNYGQYSADCFDLLKQMDLGEVDWLGTSMGGLIGMIVAASRENPMRKMVLNDIGPFLPLSAMQRIGAYVGKEMRFVDLRQAEIYCRQIYSGFGIKKEQDWQDFTKDTVKPAEGGGFALHYDAAIAAAFLNVTEDVDAWGIFDAIKIPVLVLRGEMSDTLLPNIAEEMTRRGPKAKLITIPGVGHAPALVDADQIEMIRSFLEE